MTRFDGPSRCSAGTPIVFRWYGVPSAIPGEDLDRATEAFFASIRKDGRLWNPWNRAMLRAEFRDRVLRAQAGKLVPLTEVKFVDADNPPPMYEIRWVGITLESRLPDGGSQFDDVEVRMYHSEPLTLKGYFVGHHVHEKAIAGSDTNRLQNEQIQIAKSLFDFGVPENWGVQELL